MKHLEVAVAVIFHSSKVLIARRKQSGVLGGFWEFPGGKREPGETLEECVRREVWEEVAVRVQPVMSFSVIHHRYADREVALHPFLCTYESGEPRPIACDELHWVTPPQLRLYQFPEANRQLIDDLINALPGEKASATSPARQTSRLRQIARV